MIRSERRGLYDSKRPTFERDSVGYSPDGTVVPAHYPRFTPGNYAMEFSGGVSSDRDYVDTGITHEMLKDGFTFECWVRRRSQGLSQSPTLLGANATNAILVYVRDNGAITFYPRTSRSSSWSNVLTENVWTHVALTFNNDGSDDYENMVAELFVNGESVGTRNPSQTLNENGYHYVVWLARKSYAPTLPSLLGEMDEVRFWNYVRSPQEIQDNFRKRILQAPGLIAHYGFDEGSGDIAYDTSGNGHHGTIHGAKYTDHTPFPPYDKSILIEEGTTNQFSNPFFNPVIGGWTLVRSEMNSDGGRFGESSVRMGLVPGEFSSVRRAAGLIEGETYTMSAFVRYDDRREPTYGSGQDQIRFIIGNAGSKVNFIKPVGDGWHLVSATGTSQSNTTSTGIWFYNPTVGLTVSHIQIEPKPYSTSFTVGTRAPERLMIPTAGIINPEEGQIDVDFLMPDPNSLQNTARIFDLPSATDVGIIALAVYFYENGNVWRLQYREGSLTQTANIEMDPGQRRLTVAWGDFGVRPYVDGVLISTPSRRFDYPFRTHLTLGAREDRTRYSNIPFNAFRIRSRAMTDQEIADEFAQGPLRPDALTTYFLPFNGSLDTSQMVKRSPRWRGYLGVTM